MRDRGLILRRNPLGDLNHLNHIKVKDRFCDLHALFVEAGQYKPVVPKGLDGEASEPKYGLHPFLLRRDFHFPVSDDLLFSIRSEEMDQHFSAERMGFQLFQCQRNDQGLDVYGDLGSPDFLYDVKDGEAAGLLIY